MERDQYFQDFKRHMGREIMGVVSEALDSGATFRQLQEKITRRVGLVGDMAALGMSGIGGWLENARNFGTIVKDQTTGKYKWAPPGYNRFR